MYRVIIADDEPVIRRGLRETIEWDALGLEIAGEASDGTEALELIRTRKVDMTKLLTKTVTLEEAPETIRDIERDPGSYMKVVVTAV